MVGRGGVGTTGGIACILDDNGQPTVTRIQTAAWAVPQVTPDRTLYVGFSLGPGRTVVQDLATGTVLGSMSGIGVLTQDGYALTTADEALGDIIVWSLDPAVWKQRACEVAGRNLTRAEWQRYLPDEPYRATCPQFAAA